MDQPTTKTFEDAANDFARFVESQGYPARLLWITSEDIVFWRGHYFVLQGDADIRRLRASARFEEGIARAVGISLEGKCQANQWTICRVYVPEDDHDAQFRMIPKQRVKMIVADDPKPAVLVGNRWWFVFLKWRARRNKTYPVVGWE